MNTLLIVVAVVVVVVTVSLNIGITIKYDLLKNLGEIKLSVFKIIVFKSEISLIAGYFNLIKKNKKVVQIKINLDKDSMKFVNDISNNFKQKIYLTKLDFSALICSKSPKTISELAGALYLITGVIGCKIKDSNNETAVSNNIKVGYLEEQFKLELSVAVLICLFDIIWTVVKSIVQRGLYEKTRKLRRKC